MGTRKLHLFLCQIFSDMKYYLIAGEASGRLACSQSYACHSRVRPQAEFRFGGRCHATGRRGLLVRHYREMAYMGFIAGGIAPSASLEKI